MNTIDNNRVLMSVKSNDIINNINIQYYIFIIFIKN